MADIIGVDWKNITRNIKKLHDQGVVRRVGPTKAVSVILSCDENHYTSL